MLPKVGTSADFRDFYCVVMLVNYVLGLVHMIATVSDYIFEVCYHQIVIIQRN